MSGKTYHLPVPTDHEALAAELRQALVGESPRTTPSIEDDGPPQPLELREGEELETYKLHRRFDRFARLVGDEAMKRLMEAHVMVIGLGGVGSWAAESLARSGIGTLTLVDFDRICVTNANRQLQALHGVIGKPKAKVLGERMALINPRATVIPIERFYNKENSTELFAARPDAVVDAIDNLTAKAHLLDHCRRLGIPVVCSTGASGRFDPTRVRVADLAETTVDPLARTLRSMLRSLYGFPTSGAMGIEAVYSTEPVQMPHELTYDNGKGFQCVCPGGANEFHSCEERNVIYGNASFVTGAFGLAAASVIVRRLLESSR
ncbi:MAG: tRNA threonylcarbamoyladenosine dehydratase [Myxococcales bacterium]|nr:tRNA threonylcarbamoyladenosine dehydratase [Myxococcales bacterium]